MTNGDSEGDGRPRSDWFTEAFDALYEVRYAHRSVDAAGPEAAFAVHALGIEPGDSVLDLCCGAGRHLVHLAEATPRAVGVDYSMDMVERARRRIGSAWIVRADMRSLPFDAVFDSVVNFFTSFGYFFDRTDNAAAAHSIYRALKPGGHFFIDHMNATYAKGNLEPVSTRTSGAYEIHETRWIDGCDRINKSTRVLREGREVRTVSESVQLYTREELEGLLSEVGLTVTQVYGDYSGAPMSSDTPRMILVGRRDV